MLAMSASHAVIFARSPAAGGRGQRHVQQQARGASLVVRADVGFCRDKISQPKSRVGEIEGTSTVVFLGADGAEIPVEVPKGGYILDAGLEAGLEVPFTCKGGICGCCVGRVAEGQIDQSDIADLSFVLTAEEVENGLAILCMSRPVSDVVRVETQSDWGYSLGSNDWKGPTGHLKGKSIDPLMGQRWGERRQAETAAAE